MNCCHPFTGQCEEGHGCPVRSTPLPAAIGSACCHRPDCADEHCPGRPDRPPRTATLQAGNSDGSCPGYCFSSHEMPRAGAAIDWLVELRYWCVVWGVTAAGVGALVLLADYFIRL